jgi:hypothetical protein
VIAQIITVLATMLNEAGQVEAVAAPHPTDIT